MIRYSTTTSVGIADKFKKEPITALEYVKNKNKQLKTIPSEIDFINVLQVEVLSQVDGDQMHELITSLYPDLTDLLGDSEKIGVAINIGENCLKKLIYRDDKFEDVRESLMQEYTSHIASSTIVNKGKNFNSSDPVM